MFDDTKIDAFIKQVLDNLPTELTQIKQDLEKNIRAAINSSFSKMELVTREEFDVQAALLARTRVLLEEMEQKVEQLEKALSEENQSK
jgi:BMFP domain-containing protein YqiC